MLKYDIMESIEAEISNVSNQLAVVEREIQLCTNADEKKYLWKKEEQLREEKLIMLRSLGTT